MIPITKVGNPKGKGCNKTHLDVNAADERKIVHRDYFAHSLRWSYAIRQAKYKMRVLDMGCARAPLLEALYRNKFCPVYRGVDVSKKQLEEAAKLETNCQAELFWMDATEERVPLPDGWAELECCFEMAEHVPEEKLPAVLDELERLLSPKGKLLLSTPNFNGSAAGNHVREYTFEEMEKLLAPRFEIEACYGTFASQKDLEPKLSLAEEEVWSLLKDYYDSNVFSVLFAPAHPEESRNVLWRCSKRGA